MINAFQYPHNLTAVKHRKNKGLSYTAIAAKAHLYLIQTIEITFHFGRFALN